MFFDRQRRGGGSIGTVGKTGERRYRVRICCRASAGMRVALGDSYRETVMWLADQIA
jgi:hypothetical protein